MQPEFFKEFSDFRVDAERVRCLYKKLKTSINPASDLSAFLAEIDKSVDLEGSSADPPIERRVRLARAGRVIDAILSASGDPNAEATLKRVAKKQIDHGRPGISQGKDALWELDLLLYSKRRGIGAVFAEPDVTLNLPFGSYFVACKNVNSMDRVRPLVSRGVEQIAEHGGGCVALNFDAFLGMPEPILAGDPREVTQRLRERLSEILGEFKGCVGDYISSGKLDGIMLSMTCVAKIEVSRSIIDTVTQALFSTCNVAPSKDAKVRFACFQQAMSGPLATDRHGFPTNPSIDHGSALDDWFLPLVSLPELRAEAFDG